MKHHTRYTDIPAYETRDGSTIRELMHPDQHTAQHQSLAEAIVAPGATTRLHRHQRSEEIYHIIAGAGIMTLGKDRFPVGPGDSVCIAPGTAHCIHNPGEHPLHILCLCSPAYAHADTELLNGTA